MWWGDTFLRRSQERAKTLECLLKGAGASSKPPAAYGLGSLERIPLEWTLLRSAKPALLITWFDLIRGCPEGRHNVRIARDGYRVDISGHRPEHLRAVDMFLGERFRNSVTQNSRRNSGAVTGLGSYLGEVFV